MYRVTLSFTLLLTYTSASMFTIIDTQGKTFSKQNMKHHTNAYLSQNATEYSFQAIYDELHRAENLARRAEAARRHAQRIAKAQAQAQREGKVYTLTLADKKQLLEDAKYYKGGKYVWGGTTPKGFDCSGYVQYLYKKHHISLPRTALAQSKRGISIQKNALQKGDLLFFLTDKKRGIPVTHVGIYIGNGQFIHAASRKQGIIVSPITTGHYADTFVTARRVLSST